VIAQAVFVAGGEAAVAHEHAAAGDHVARPVRGRAENQDRLHAALIELRERIVVEYDEIGRRAVGDGSRARLRGGKAGDAMAAAGRKREDGGGARPSGGVGGAEPRQ